MNKEQNEQTAMENLNNVVNPNREIARSKEMADALVRVVEQKKLYTMINGKKFLHVEAWQLLGRFCSLWGKIIESKPVELWNHHGFESTASIIDSTGAEISRANAVCMDDEPNWKNKSIFELKAMSQTRALSRAYRTSLSFIVSLAGYESGAAEEARASSSSQTTRRYEIDEEGEPPTRFQKEHIFKLMEGDKKKKELGQTFITNLGKVFVQDLSRHEVEELIVVLKEYPDEEGDDSL